MKVDALNTNKEIHSSAYNPRYVVSVCVLFSLLICGRAINDVFFYMFAGISLLIFAVSNTGHCFLMLLFLLPSATILKQGADNISFFTVLFFLVVLKMAIERKKFNANFLIITLIFLAYNLFFSGSGQLNTIISMIAGMVMLYCLRTLEVDAGSCVVSYSSGIVFSSVLALFRNKFPIISMFVQNIALKLGENSYSSRFSGLKGNPNYYTVDIIIALAVLISLMCYRKTGPTYVACVAALSVFGLMSVSKSFLFALCLLIFIWFLFAIKQGVDKFMKFILIAIIAAAVIYFFAYDSINLYLFRFNADRGGSLGDITTGRTNIWKQYVDVIASDFKILFFGNGLKTLIFTGRGAHNTYLESIFTLGLSGTAIFIANIRACTGKLIVHPIILIPVIMLMFRMLAIGVLTDDNLWFYLGLFVILAKTIKGEEIARRGESV